MKKDVLIAGPHNQLRNRLRNAMTGDRRVAHVYEVTTRSELALWKVLRLVDVFFVHQSLISDFTQLPPRKSVIIATEPSMTALIHAYNAHACAYFTEQVPSDLLCAVLSQRPDGFLVDPLLAPLLIGYFSQYRRARQSAREETDVMRQMSPDWKDILPDWD